MKFSKNALYFIIGFSVVGLGLFGYQSLIGNRTPTEKKTSPASLENTKAPESKPIISTLINDPVNFVDVPAEVVVGYLHDVYKIVIIPGQYKDMPVTFSGQFSTPLQAKQAFLGMLKKHDLGLNGSPLTIVPLAKEPVFTRVNWGSANGQIYLFHGAKLYKVEEFPYMIRRDMLGNFHAALPM